MIGIAVCYTNEEQFSALCRNIGSTCGADRIICGVDNRDGTYDIFSAYEKMAGELTAYLRGLMGWF